MSKIRDKINKMQFLFIECDLLMGHIILTIYTNIFGWLFYSNYSFVQILCTTTRHTLTLLSNTSGLQGHNILQNENLRARPVVT